MKRMKRTRTALILTAIPALMLAACGQGDTSGTSNGEEANGEEEAGTCLAEAKDDGRLVVGASGNLPIGGFTETDSELTGLIPALLEEFAEHEGIGVVEAVPMDFDSYIPSMQSGRIMLAADALYVTDERLEAVEFTDRLWYGPEIMIVKEGNPKELQNLSDLGPEDTIATYSGSAWVEWIDELSEEEGVGTNTYKTASDVMNAVSSDLVDAGLLTAYVAGYALTTKSDYGFEFADEYEVRDREVVQDHIAVRKECTDLVDAFNTFYQEEMLDTGDIEPLMEEWGLTPPDFYLDED